MLYTKNERWLNVFTEYKERKDIVDVKKSESRREILLSFVHQH